MQLYPETRQPQAYVDPRMTQMLTRRNSSMSEIVGDNSRRRTKIPPIPVQQAPVPKPPTRRAMSMEELQNRHRQKLRELQDPVNKDLQKKQQEMQGQQRHHRGKPQKSRTAPVQHQHQHQQRPPRRRRHSHKHYMPDQAPPLPPLPAAVAR